MHATIVRRLLLCALVLFGVPADASESTVFAFQGLPWGASEVQIDAKFNGPLRRTVCDEKRTKIVAERLGEVCSSPYVEPYDVAGISFTLGLHLALQSRVLNSVTLFHASAAAQPNKGEARDAMWRDRHRALRRALADRYGQPDAGDVVGNAGVVIANNIWRRSGTNIELKSTFMQPAGAPAEEQYQILYRQAAQGSGGKL